jgi:small-conductance mechanosensitive channel
MGMHGEISKLFVPVVIILSGLVTGIIVRLFISRKWDELQKIKGRGYEIVINSLKRSIILWLFLVGLLIALPLFPFSSSLLKFLDKTVLLLIVFSVTLVSAKMASQLIEVYTESIKDHLPRTSIFETIAKFTIYVIGILIALQILDISIAPILTALGIGGLAVALALQDTLSNFFAGLHIIISRQIRPGDYVRLESGEEGYVEDISWRTTTIRQLSNNTIIVPNSKLSSSIILNYHLPESELAVLIDVGVSYESDLEHVEKVTLAVAKEVMKEVPGGVPDFEPLIRYHTFGDYSIKFTVILRAKDFSSQYLIKHEFIKRLYDRYKKEGITIPFPVRTLYIENRSQK